MDIYKSHPKHVKYNHFNHVILGAGLAGLTLSMELLQKEQRVLLIDLKYPGSGASGTPAGLMNPATAQKALMPDDALNCVRAFSKILNKLLDQDNSEIILHEKVLRPAMDQKLLANFNSTLDEPWPDGWVEWINKLTEDYPQIPGFKGGLLLNIGKAIDVPKYLSGMFNYCRNLNLNYSFGGDYSLIEDGEKFKLQIEDVILSAENIINCTGSTVPDITDFKLHKVKGQIRIVEDTHANPLSIALSSYGYLAQKNDCLIVGSTYEHHFSDVAPTAKQDDILLNKIKLMTGRNYLATDIRDRWAGVRITTPDRKPAIGSLLTQKNYYYYTGLGSKGLFYSAFMSELLSDHILNNTPIPVKYHITRLLSDKQKKSD